MFDRMSKNMGQTDRRREPARRRRQLRHRRGRPCRAGRLHAGRRRLRPGRGEPHALQDARLRPREGPRDDLAVRGLHHRRRRQQEAAGHIRSRSWSTTPRRNPGQLNYGSVGIGSLAASRRRVFRPDQRRQADPRALPQHRPVRARPDRRHSAARLPVVSERRRPDPGQGRQPARGRGRQAPRDHSGYADHHRSRHAAIQGARLVRAAGAGTARRSRSSRGSTRK